MMWVNIPGRAGYQVSDSFGVRSLDRTIEGRRGIVKGRELSTWIRSGRLAVRLGAGQIFYVDDLMAAAFGASTRSGAKCSRGHSLVSALTWGSGNRQCAACVAGVPRVRQLPEII